MFAAMKKYFPAFLLFMVCACSCDSLFGPSEKKIADTTADSASGKSASTPPDTLPHEVFKGKKGNYAYLPDTSFNDVVLGDPVSFRAFARSNGETMTKIEGKRFFASYLTATKSEWLTIYLTKKKNGQEVPYGYILQKAGQPGAPKVPGKPDLMFKNNVVTGHNIYIGMTQDYVMQVYLDQVFTQWQSGDTVYLRYQPKAKDANYYKRYGWEGVTVTYKFVNDRLRRIEYFVKPEDLEAR